MFRPLILALPLLAAGCMSTSDLTSRNAPPDFGSSMTQSQCQSLAQRHVGTTLLRPNSAQYKFGRCMAETMPAKPLLGLPKQSGYAMSFAVDAENAFGSYTGYRSYEILIHNGQIVRRVRRSLENGNWERF